MKPRQFIMSAFVCAASIGLIAVNSQSASADIVLRDLPPATTTIRTLVGAGFTCQQVGSTIICSKPGESTYYCGANGQCQQEVVRLPVGSDRPIITAPDRNILRIRN